MIVYPTVGSVIVDSEVIGRYAITENDRTVRSARRAYMARVLRLGDSAKFAISVPQLVCQHMPKGVRLEGAVSTHSLHNAKPIGRMGDA